MRTVKSLRLNQNIFGISLNKFYQQTNNQKACIKTVYTLKSSARKWSQASGSYQNDEQDSDQRGKERKKDKDPWGTLFYTSPVCSEKSKRQFIHDSVVPDSVTEDEILPGYQTTKTVQYEKLVNRQEFYTA